MQNDHYDQCADHDDHEEREARGRRQLEQLRHRADQLTVDPDNDDDEGDRQDEEEPRLLDPADMTDAERRARDELTRELLHLRNTALRAANVTVDHQVTNALNTGLLRFGDGMPVTIVCAQLPADKLERMPYTDPADPGHVALYSYADLDALVELHGHVRAANPTSQVNWRAAHQLEPDDYTAHLISFGGVDWNVATQSVLDRLRLPVRQVADWNSPEGPYFEVDEGGRAVKHYPSLELSEGRQALREDVTFFSGSELFCILTRVTVANGVPLTPELDHRREPALRMVELTAMAGADSQDHHGSHRDLLWTLDEPSSRLAQVDAVIVPTVRHPAYLQDAADLALGLDCPLVTLHSGKWTSAREAAQRLP